MAKVLSLQDLMDRKASEISGEDLTDVYDLIVPLGVPQSIIIDMVDMFELEVTERVLPSEDPDIGGAKVLVLRGTLEAVQEAEKFMKQVVHAWINA